MVVDNDETVPLPTPPPPRPAARRTAIETALRRFDGVEGGSGEREVRRRPVQKWWATMHRRPAAALATTALIAVISVPVALVALRNEGVVPRDRQPTAFQPRQDGITNNRPMSETLKAQADQQVAAAEPPPTVPGSASPKVVAVPAEGAAAPRQAENTIDETPAMPAAPAAPPPPPPAPARSAQDTGEPATQDMVVTGSRIARPTLEKQSDLRVAERSANSAGSEAGTDTYDAFLARLQTALRANDRRAVMSLVGLPLRVNFDDRRVTYRSLDEVERDFDLIFTPGVRRSVLSQSRDMLRSGRAGMMGNSRIRFAPSCTGKASCKGGPISLREVSP